MKMRSAWIFWFLLGSAVIARAEVKEEPAAQPEEMLELEPITVTGQINPLDASLFRLRKMMEDAPCMGCGPLQEAARENPYLKVGSFLSFVTGAALEPPNPSPEERLEGRIIDDWKWGERGPEFDAFR